MKWAYARVGEGMEMYGIVPGNDCAKKYCPTLAFGEGRMKPLRSKATLGSAEGPELAFYSLRIVPFS
ncbi:hypothetical protein [Hymenobacter terricola]|uniref:hypothetical protein n=1 Tax=Hymenobacter terricola TaxID=2819236 RepID=UPI001B30E525|nr:hypothetical protein [Hymenobacter terricola]